MDFSKIFKTRKEQPKATEAPSHWVKCEACGSLMYRKEIMLQANVCPKCGFHMRINVMDRINLLSDKNTFVSFDKNLIPIDPLKFVDKKSYKKRIEEAHEKTKRNSALIAGECKIEDISVQLVVFDFEFMGGSLASVEGEMIVRAAKRAIEKRQGLVIVSASGGARMQESTFSLMQMAKTSAILTKLSEAKLPYISVLTDPTMGGVSASFAWLGDVIIAEPGALIGFAGQRVIKQTIGAELPEGFQRAEFLLKHGLIDMIIQRSDLKRAIADLLRYFISEQSEHANKN
ncbi:MAG: acetyl-CoA carboxylase, carboxyltransferase subunit beta [Campylobacteraceae bacterium]|jgi:acetyl-CoA carboxylase carboxyl transferase subunit beta|nr:acetyl-CoA carboxylase, carboxyltransferase subunit beta [Campylobacteraceae bacterium]